MPSSFVAAWEFAVGSMSFIPFVGIRDSSKTTNAIKEIGLACDLVLDSKVPVSNSALIQAKAASTPALDDHVIPLCLVRPTSQFGSLLLNVLGGVLDTSYATMQAQSGVPPAPPVIFGYWTAAAGPLAVSQVLGIAVARYISAIMPPPTGSGAGEGP